jgi:hypothetical protein
MNLIKKIFLKINKISKIEPETGYQQALKEEIANFREVENIHDLPDIFHYWSNKYLLPNFYKSGFSSVDEFFAKNLINTLVKNPVFLSIGSGYCDTEIRVAKLLKEKGCSTFKFECIELNPHLIQRGKDIANAEGMTEHMIFTEADFNEWKPKITYAGIMANHSLHHAVNLEDLFDNIKNSLDNFGNFIANDMIGRNGHQRWPEALEIVNQLWKELPDNYRYNHQLQRHEPEFINWDCSSEGFEGIRAQDILPLLLQRFNFKYFYGFANVIGPFIDRGFGHNFDANANWDRAFIDRLHAIDEEGFKSGYLKPTQMLAVMTKTEVKEVVNVRGLTPNRSVRAT